MKWVAALSPLFFLTLAGCATSRPDHSDEALSHKSGLIGKSREYLLRCAGIPDKTYNEDGMILLQYSFQSGMARGGGLTLVDQRFGLSASGFVAQNYNCYATVELRDGQISNVSYKAITGGPADLCSVIFQPCFPEENQERNLSPELIEHKEKEEAGKFLGLSPELLK